MKDIEIEFKALLTDDLYEKLINDHTANEELTYVSHYFDTEDDVLKNNNMALRIRVKENCNKLTLKHQIKEDEDAYYVEVSDFLGICETRDAIDKKIIVSSVLQEYLNDFDISLDTLSKYNSFTTKRIICNFDDHILFLDKTSYANGAVDYELEIESLTYDECKMNFDLYSNKYNLERNFIHKIERAILNK